MQFATMPSYTILFTKFVYVARCSSCNHTNNYELPTISLLFRQLFFQDTIIFSKFSHRSSRRRFFRVIPNLQMLLLLLKNKEKKDFFIVVVVVGVDSVDGSAFSLFHHGFRTVDRWGTRADVLGMALNTFRMCDLYSFRRTDIHKIFISCPEVYSQPFFALLNVYPQ